MAPKLDGSALISALKQLDFQVRVISFLNYTYWYKTCKRNHAKTDQPKYFSLGTRILQPNYGRAKMCGGHVLCIYRSKYVCFVLLQWTCDWSWKWCLFSLERHEFKGKDTFKCKDMSGAVLRGTARVAYRQDSFIFIYFISGWRTTGWFIVPRQQWGRW